MVYETIEQRIGSFKRRVSRGAGLVVVVLALAIALAAALKADLVNGGEVGKHLQKLQKPEEIDKALGTAIGKSIGNILMGLLMPAVNKVQSAYDRAEQVQRNLYVAFAMAAYHRDNGRYPAKLADLAPNYLPTVPGDIFSGKPLIYRPAANGYLFYSVGANGKDDDGRWADDTPPGDDPNVRMPLKPLKK